MNDLHVKNYTSSVPVDRSIQLIEHNLVRAGAKHIAKSYDERQNVIGLIFQIDINNTPLTFKLPSKADRVHARMEEEMRRTRSRPPKQAQLDALRDQANRTAWRLLYDLVAVQVSNIIIDQVEPIEAFMPYLYDGKNDRTLFEYHKERSFKALLPESTSTMK